MAKLTPELEIKLKNLPTSAGVYLFKDRSGRIIYIGKSQEPSQPGPNLLPEIERSCPAHEPHGREDR